MENTRKETSFMKNVLMLMFSQVLIKILGFIYKIVIFNAEGFGDGGYGRYSAGYLVYSVLLTLSSIGIPSVIAKLVSERLAINDKVGAQRIFKIAFFFFTGIGIFLSIMLYATADFIGANILNVPDVQYVLKVLSPAICFVSATSVIRGYFAGQQDMKPTSVSQTLEQLLNCVLSITFVYALIGKETYIMAAAGNLSTTLAIIITFIYIVTYYKRKKLKIDYTIESPEKNKTVSKILKTILVISIPVTVSSLLSVISPVIDTITVSNCIQIAYSGIITVKSQLEELAMNMQGILSKVDTLVNLPLAVNLAFCTALVPAISSAIAKKDYNTASKRLSFSFFASVIIIIPCAIGFIVLAEPILQMLYPAASDGAGILQIASVTMIFVGLSQTLNGGLYGINKMAVPMIAVTVSGAIKLLLNLILVRNPEINIYGAAISSVIGQVIAFVISFTTLRKYVKIEVTFVKTIFKPIICGIIMGLTTYIISKYTLNVVGLTTSNIISIMSGAITYVILIFIFKILTKEDIMMMPYGTKLYKLLTKIKIYKE